MNFRFSRIKFYENEIHMYQQKQQQSVFTALYAEIVVRFFVFKYTMNTKKQETEKVFKN